MTDAPALAAPARFSCRAAAKRNELSSKNPTGMRVAACTVATGTASSATNATSARRAALCTGIPPPVVPWATGVSWASRATVPSRFEGLVKRQRHYAGPVNRRFSLPLIPVAIALWLGLATAVAAFTSKVANWFVMTDELLYERLAISIANTNSPLPRVHAEAVANINQLYPMVIAPSFRSLSVEHAFHQVHILNAFVMSSAAIPAYLLARRLTANRILPFFVAVATVTVPWITLAAFLLTEVAAYPAFVWALLGMQAAVARPSVRNDLFAVAAIALAVLARTQFYALAGVLPAVLVADALVGRRLKAAIREHAALVTVYAIGALFALALFATGHALLGTYS